MENSNSRHQKPQQLPPHKAPQGLAKVGEKAINQRLNTYDERLNLTRQEQFGFRPGHYTIQVTRIVADIITNYNKQKVTSMTLLDIQKAFNRVWIQGLIIIIKLYIQNSNLHGQANSIISIVCLNSKYPPPVELCWQNKNISKLGILILNQSWQYNYFINMIRKH
jgi:hypothetical protein